jgi:hypothetical protein
MRMFEPKTRMIGAFKKEVPNPDRQKLIDAYGVLTDDMLKAVPATIMIWSKPPAAEVVKHYVNEYAKRMHKKGEMDDKDAFTKVPIFRGVDNKTFRAMGNRARYKEKLATPEWKLEAAKVKSAREAA